MLRNCSICVRCCSSKVAILISRDCFLARAAARRECSNNLARDANCCARIFHLACNASNLAKRDASKALRRIYGPKKKGYEDERNE